MEKIAILDIPSYFLCPISFQIMKDPVTLTTGITYDRQEIEKWVFSDKHFTCPMTNQKLSESDIEITPNHTLRRLIQSWCGKNASQGVERIPTPTPPVDRLVIGRILCDAGKSTGDGALRKLREIFGYSEWNRHCGRNAGAADVLVTIVRKKLINDHEDDVDQVCEVALSILNALNLSKGNLRDLVENHSDIVTLITRLLKRFSGDDNYNNNCQLACRSHAIFLLKSILTETNSTPVVLFQNISSLEYSDLLAEMVTVLRHSRTTTSKSVTKASLRVIGELCQNGRNRVQAVKAGAVKVLVDILLDFPEKKVCEMAVVILDNLCGCAEGREQLVGHPGGVAVVGKKIGRVSGLVTDRGVRILYMVAKRTATAALVSEMMELGVVSKLCAVLYLECCGKTKERVREILRLHSKAWSKSRCVIPHLITSNMY